ncbi:MAG: pyridoxal-phosphate-dependent aminotransferase family protein [Gemmatimonadota bacterium]
MTPDRPAFGSFFLPGPVEVHPDVLAALSHPMIPHRGPVLQAMLERMAAPLRRLFRTAHPVMIGTCSATGFMEAAVRAGVRRRVLVLVNGVFAERFAVIAERCGKEVVRVRVPPGRAVEPDQLEALFDGPAVDAVALVHSETSTGALSDLEGLARVVRRRPDVLLLVDAVTSLAALPVETDAWGIDFVFTGSQKALALPPGLALGVASPRLLERARALADRGFYLDLVELHAAAVEHRPTQTPALSLYFALERQLERIEAAGGVEPRWERHRAMLALMEAWAADRSDVRIMAPPGRRSWSVTALELAPGLPSDAVVARLAAAGWTVGTGLEELRDTVIRVGHMGDLAPAHLEALLEALGAALSGSPVPTP